MLDAPGPSMNDQSAAAAGQQDRYRLAITEASSTQQWHTKPINTGQQPSILKINNKDPGVFLFLAVNICNDVE